MEATTFSSMSSSKLQEMIAKIREATSYYALSPVIVNKASKVVRMPNRVEVYGDSIHVVVFTEEGRTTVALDFMTGAKMAHLKSIITNFTEVPL